MKKLFAKDRENRKTIKQLELEHFILKQILANPNFSKQLDGMLYMDFLVCQIKALKL